MSRDAWRVAFWLFAASFLVYLALAIVEPFR